MRGAIALSALSLCACVWPRPSPRPAPRPPVSAEDRVEADKAYYQAVSAYMAGDFVLARELLKPVQRLSPGHAGARTLREKLDAADAATRTP